VYMCALFYKSNLQNYIIYYWIININKNNYPNSYYNESLLVLFFTFLMYIYTYISKKKILYIYYENIKQN